jgi:hypothetical protein
LDYETKALAGRDFEMVSEMTHYRHYPLEFFDEFAGARASTWQYRPGSCLIFMF